MSIIDVAAADSSLEKVSAAIEGVLRLLEPQCERSEECFSAFCLLELVRARLGLVMAGELQVH